MLKMMRDSFQHLKWILVAIVATFILFIFVDWGAGGANGAAARGNGFAARVNGETITLRDFDRALYNREQSMKQMYGGQLTQEMIDQMGLPKQVLDSLVDQQLLMQEAQRMHLSASSEEVRKQILEIPILNPDGKFVGPEYYQRYISASGYQSAADFEDELARYITMQKMESALASSVMVSPKMADAEYRRISENAKIHYVLYPASRESATATVTPAEVEAFYKANQTKYAHAEQRDIRYLMAEFSRLRSQIVPPEADLKKRYEASREQFKVPESAHILHILIKVDPSAAPEIDKAAREKAESIVKQLRAGADFATLAKANSGDPSSSSKGGDMGFVNRAATVPEFDTQAFSIPLNQISDPIRTPQFGYHIIKVLERKPESVRSFEEVKAQLASQVAEQMAKDMARDEASRMAQRLKQTKPATADAFAALAGDKLTSYRTDWFQKNDPIPGLGVNPALSSWAFVAKQGDIGEIVGTQRGIVIPYLAGIREAGTSKLDEIKERVTQDAKMSKARDLARQALANAMAGAPSVDAVAAKVGLKPADTTVNRQGYIGGIQGDTAALVSSAFAANIGELKGPVVAGDGAIVFQVTEQKKVTDAELKSNQNSYMEMLRSQQARSLRTVLLQKLRKEAKVEMNDQVVQSRSKSQGA